MSKETDLSSAKNAFRISVEKLTSEYHNKLIELAKEHNLKITIDSFHFDIRVK